MLDDILDADTRTVLFQELTQGLDLYNFCTTVELPQLGRKNEPCSRRCKLPLFNLFILIKHLDDKHNFVYIKESSCSLIPFFNLQRLLLRGINSISDVKIYI